MQISPQQESKMSSLAIYCRYALHKSSPVIFPSSRRLTHISSLLQRVVGGKKLKHRTHWFVPPDS